ncbi:MAG: hypothetical protein KatS3mg087_0086 [Patescibacteria group bacterium]|nr:MAG: hypothetical protein KatS3mg087_0086 [Patescibacteria group bacterium]
MIKGLSRFVAIPSEEINPTEEQRAKFLEAVLSNKPFFETIKIGDWEITFTSPSIKDYIQLGNASAEDYEGYLFTATIGKVERTGDILYVKKRDYSFPDRLQILEELFENSSILPLVIERWYRYIIVLSKLFSESLDKNFFGNTPSGGQSLSMESKG